MCRSIKPLYNFDPPTQPNEIEAAALQFVRKITGFHRPSKTNEAAFSAAVAAIARVSSQLLDNLETQAPPRNRLIEITKAQARAKLRFPGPMPQS